MGELLLCPLVLFPFKVRMSSYLDKQLDLSVKIDDALDATCFEPARWPGGPVICHKANLPAFPTRDVALGWHSEPNKTNPQYEVRLVKNIWQCSFSIQA